MIIRNPSHDYDLVQKEILENIDSVLSDLLKKSGMSIDENQKLVSRYHSFVADAADTKDNILRLRFEICLCVLSTIFLLVSSFILIYFGIIGISQRTLQFLLILPGVALCIPVVFPIRKIQYDLSPALKDNKILRNELEKNIIDSRNKCKASIKPYLDQFHDELIFKLIEMTLEGMNIDSFLTNYRVESMKQLTPSTPFFMKRNGNQSTLEVASGDYYYNPFILNRTLNHHIDACRYFGTAIVDVEYYETDRHGNRVLKTRKEKYTKHVDKPKPCFNSELLFALACPEVSNLTFTHKSTNNRKKSRKKLIKQRMHELNELIKKQVRCGINNIITPMSNEEFEGLFAAFDRNNDLLFRKMFTPDAQKNIVDLIDDPRFGDYFNFTKVDGIAYISISNDNWEMDTSISCFQDMLDYHEITAQFKKIVLSYFDHFYKYFSPIFCIPIYSLSNFQRKNKVSVDMRTSEYAAEVLANSIGSEAILGFKTNVIITASERAQRAFFDSYSLDVFFYEEYPRITTVSFTASDGKSHDVDVEWTEYIPRHKYTTINILTNCYNGNDSVNSLINYLKNNNFPYIYKHGLFAWIGSPDNTLPDDAVAHFFSKK